MELSTTKRPKDEVSFVNHIFEFVRFYNNHRLFCDQISGIKGRQVLSNQNEEQVYITEKNFVLAIRKLNAFIIDNLHYIKDLDDARTMQEKVEQLEDDFNSDRSYHSLNDASARSDEEEIVLQQKYFRYLLRCFELANDLVRLLQNSLMVSPADTKKYISYHNPASFFENLSYYRDEMSNDLSQFSLDNSLNHVKKCLGYVYSYKNLLHEEERLLIERLQKRLIAYVLDPLTIEHITQVKSRMYDEDDLKAIKGDIKRIRFLLQNLYYLTNKCLSSRNIMPKIQRKIFLDKTTI